jgi:hypothetical protein
MINYAYAQSYIIHCGKNMGEEHIAHLPLSPLQKRGMYQNNMYLTFISALNLQ